MAELRSLSYESFYLDLCTGGEFLSLMQMCKQEHSVQTDRPTGCLTSSSFRTSLSRCSLCVSPYIPQSVSVSFSQLIFITESLYLFRVAAKGR